MKLSTFITENMEEILAQWGAFAETLRPAAAKLSPAALRDDARQILESIARDIALPEGAPRRVQTLDGATVEDENGDSAAAYHGTLRQMSGFSLIQLTEYRALRASVLRLWLPAGPVVGRVYRAAAAQWVKPAYFPRLLSMASIWSMMLFMRAASAW